MRIAVIADVHSNLEALEVVIADIERMSPDTVISLGDVVGYGADPEHCCELVSKAATVNITGNHDAAVTGLMDTEYFNDDAKAAIEWTKTRLPASALSWLGNTKYSYEDDDLMFSHGSPVAPDSFDYVVTLGAIKEIFNTFGHRYRIFFVGHSHRRFVVSKDPDSGQTVVEDVPDTLEIKKNRQYLVSVGSIGQPRDNDRTTSYGILDTDKWIYSVKRLSYDIMKASDKIMKAGLPKWLAYRLMIGV